MRVFYARRLNLDVYVVFADNPDYLEHLAGLAGSDSGEEDDIGKARSRSQSSSPARPRRGQKYNDEHTLERKYSKCRAVHMMSFLLLVLHVFVTRICQLSSEVKERSERRKIQTTFKVEKQREIQTAHFAQYDSCKGLLLAQAVGTRFA